MTSEAFEEMQNVHGWRKELCEQTDIKLVFLNVCGLNSKLLIPEVQAFLNKYDILCFCETKTGDADYIDIPGYKHIMNSRYSYSLRNSDRIVVAVKIKYVNCIDFDIRSTSDYILWFRVHMGKNNPSLLVGTVYIPPEGLPCNTVDTFQTVAYIVK